MNPYNPPANEEDKQLPATVCCPVCGENCGRWRFLYRSVRCNGCGMKLGRKSPDVVHIANFIYLIVCGFLAVYLFPSVSDSRLFLPCALFISFASTSIAGIWIGHPWPYNGFRFFPRNKLERYREQYRSVGEGQQSRAPST